MMVRTVQYTHVTCWKCNLPTFKLRNFSRLPRGPVFLAKKRFRLTRRIFIQSYTNLFTKGECWLVPRLGQDWTGHVRTRIRALECRQRLEPQGWQKQDVTFPSTGSQWPMATLGVEIKKSSRAGWDKDIIWPIAGTQVRPVEPTGLFKLDPIKPMAGPTWPWRLGWWLEGLSCFKSSPRHWERNSESSFYF